MSSKRASCRRPEKRTPRDIEGRNGWNSKGTSHDVLRSGKDTGTNQLG